MERDDLMVKSDVLLTERVGNILVLTLNRPEVRNALNPELGLTGEPITARRAQELGLVNKVVPAAQVRDEALKLAQKIAENAPLAVAITKKLLRERRWGTAEETSAVFRSADAMEGARAFAERRAPVWTGK